MAKRTKSQENSMLLDPNRERIAKNMTVLPGGPENNNPMNVTSVTDGPVTAESIYGDYKQNYPQMGAGIINPGAVGHSGLPGPFPKTALGFNQQPYGTQQQPDASGISQFWDAAEGSRLAGYGKAQGLPVAQMGLIGGPPIPGFVAGDMPGTSGPPLMPGQQSIVPGSSPTKINKKGKRTE